MRTKWITLPPKEGELLFRRHIRKPDDPEMTFCGRAVVPCLNDRKLRQCGLCNRNSDRYRNPPPPRVTARQSGGGSIRALRGGLPGLGRR